MQYIDLLCCKNWAALNPTPPAAAGGNIDPIFIGFPRLLSIFAIALTLLIPYGEPTENKHSNVTGIELLY